MKTIVKIALTKLTVVSMVALLAACGGASSADDGDDDTDNGGSAQSEGCGSPVSRTPLAPKNYVMTRPGSGDVFAKLYMDEATGKFKAAKTSAGGDESLVGGSFKITPFRCATSDRNLSLDIAGSGANASTTKLTFSVKPLASGSLEFTEVPPRDGQATYAKFEMQPIADGESRFTDLACVSTADCTAWATANHIAVPRCGRWSCTENACKHSSGVTDTRGPAPSSCQ